MIRLITSKAYLREIAGRLKKYRISKRITQYDLAIRSGVSLRSISRFEQGGDIQLGNLIKILQALGLQDNLELLVPDMEEYPSFRSPSTPKYRARKAVIRSRGFKWGDES